MLALTAALATGALPKTITIAPGVEMPRLNFGMSNHSLFIELGGRGLDSAFIYGDDAQRETGHAVRASGLPRSEIFVTTKIPCCPASSFIQPGVCAALHANATRSIEHDLKTLGLGYVDLMLLHWPCAKWEDTLATYRAMVPMLHLMTARAIGVSNFNASAIRRLVGENVTRPAVNQCGFSIGGHAQPLWGRDDETVAACKAAGITYSAYSPLGGWTKVDVLKDPGVLAIAASHGKTAAQVALRWVAQQDIVVVTSSNEPSHDEADLGIFDFELSDAEMARLSAVHAHAK